MLLRLPVELCAFLQGCKARDSQVRPRALHGLPPLSEVLVAPLLRGLRGSLANDTALAVLDQVVLLKPAPWQ